MWPVWQHNAVTALAAMLGLSQNFFLVQPVLLFVSAWFLLCVREVHVQVMNMVSLITGTITGMVMTTRCRISTGRLAQDSKSSIAFIHP